MEPEALDDFLAWNPPPTRSILGHGILYEQGKLILYGAQKTFKSMWAMYLIYCFRAGNNCCNISVPDNGVSVLYLQLEISHKLLQKRAKTMWTNFTPKGKLAPIHFWTEPMLKLTGSSEGSGLQRLYKEMAKFHPDVLIIDPLYKVLDERIGDQLAMSRLFDNLDMLAAKFNCAIIIIAHPRKQPAQAIPEGQADPYESADLMGSNLFAAWADTIVHMTRLKGQADVRRLTFEATRYAEEELEPLDIFFDRASMQFKQVTLLT